MEAIKNAVFQIRRDRRNGLSRKELEERYENFNKNYPRLFTMIADNLQEDYMDILNKMLASVEQVQDGLYTQEEMDKKIGFDLAKHFVYPNIDMSRETEITEKLIKESEDLEDKIAKRDQRHYEEIRREQLQKEEEEDYSFEN